jgi:hypothetical protein
MLSYLASTYSNYKEESKKNLKDEANKKQDARNL